MEQQGTGQKYLMGIFIEEIPLCFMSYKINCLFNELQDKQIAYSCRQTQQYI